MYADALYYGKGVPKDIPAAVQWYLRAAEQGNPIGQFNAARAYASGEGIASNFTRAYALFELAAANPGAPPQMRTSAEQTMTALREKMTSAQVADAQRFVKEWKPGQPIGQAVAIAVEQPLAVLLGYLNSAGYRAYLDKIVAMTEPEPLKGACNDLRIVDATEHFRVTEPTFSREGGGLNVETGAWVTRMVVDRCGTEVKRRVLVRATGGNQLESVRLFPGDFRGDLTLERDVTTIVLVGFSAMAKCDGVNNVHVLDIKSLADAAPASWSELWTVNACGTVFTGQMQYSRSPDKPGIHFELGDIKKAESFTRI